MQTNINALNKLNDISNGVIFFGATCLLAGFPLFAISLVAKFATTGCRCYSAKEDVLIFIITNKLKQVQHDKNPKLVAYKQNTEGLLI